MIIEANELKDLFLQKNYDKFMVELNSFFGFKWKKNKPNIIIVPDRKTIDKIKGMKTERWVVGWSNNFEIFLLDRKNFEKESCHKYSDEKYLSILKHELAHSYFSIISKGNDNPIWLNEGIAIYLSDQLKFKKIPDSFKKLLSFYNKGGKEVYDESGFAIKILVERFGKIKILRLIKLLNKVNSEKEFNSFFKQIYEFEPNYKNFNKLLNNTQKKKI